MSFQGDVGGIGLAELLQSLARGRREGVLTLNTQAGMVSTLGLENGVLFLLPEPGEESSVWKERARQAWVRSPDHRMEGVRTAEIARAHRTERLYRILDSEGVHFRFDQRKLPGRAEHALDLADGDASGGPGSVGAPRQPQVYCEGVSVEYLLLEYARMGDELASFGEEVVLAEDDVPIPIQPPEQPAAGSLLAQCDGDSTIAEISDRLACPIRQGILLVADGLRQGVLRLARPGELMAMARVELAEGHVQRASARLRAWVRFSTPGQASHEDALGLEQEWRADRLTPLLARMSGPLVRALVRRIDHALGDPAIALHHWRELRRMRRDDLIVEVHHIALESRAEGAEDSLTLRELLETARTFRSGGRPRRAAAILRMAAARMPTSSSARHEIGIGLVAAGLIEEGAPWILDTARAHMAAGTPEKAIAPLRALIEVAPELREARRLLVRARNVAMRRDIVRKHAAIGIALIVALALGAWVQIRAERRFDRQIDEVSSLLTHPLEAQELFDRYFSSNDSSRVKALGATIQERRRALETGLRTEWYARYREAQLECSFGDPVAGIERALAVPSPPVLVTVTEPWPLVSDLYNGLAARLEGELQGLGEPQLDAPQQVRAEEDLGTRTRALVVKLDERGRPAVTEHMHARLTAILDRLRERAESRRTRTEERDRMDVLMRQELMLQSARAHSKAGELERALAVYDRLIAEDPTGRLATIGVLAEEIQKVRTRYTAVEDAHKLALSGRHAEAIEKLVAHLERPGSVPLPWKLETYPPGALAHMADGSVRKTPFQLESRVGERSEIRLELEGTRTVVLDIGDPRDRFVWLERIPERSWKSDGRVEALPVAVLQDHIVCDRAGRIARLSNDAQPRWERKLGSLGGLGQAPVFLSQRLGCMLAVTQDGEAWIVDTRDGALEGPWELGSSPVQGPLATAEGASVTLRDGRRVHWSTRLKPTSIVEGTPTESGEELVPSVRATIGGLSVLRFPSGGELRLDSPWTRWSVEIRKDVFLVHPREEESKGFAVLRQGEWVYVAWEAPRGLLPNGRLWISDGAGLRSYLP